MKYIGLDFLAFLWQLFNFSEFTWDNNIFIETIKHNITENKMETENKWGIFTHFKKNPCG